MPQGSKKKYTSKQKRKAEHIEEGYEKRGTSKKEAKKRAWATVNKSDKGGKKSGAAAARKAARRRRAKAGRRVERSRPARKRGADVGEEQVRAR
jgi:hypothetical protein